MQIIDNLGTLMAVDHIAWTDGPLWLLSIAVLSFLHMVIAAAREPST